ncbi:hypothetical protein EJB05_23226 [Eragrostis curvula]|uniref:NAD-dependent epimerase/dehydratase domain-containing protein n=1 Tax=Eragrostis curvula TaxID=38414 RepID=A0A5J9V5Z0_9POAL|nr:hypothetical protein EJB05_23226 [Eragrostis curvula]
MCPGSVESAAPGSGKSVCVMDASSPLGRALVDRLLRRGYTVHAATYCGCQREDEDDEEASSTAALLEQLSRGGEVYKHRLKVFRADPFDYHAIADAVRGCAGVFCMFSTPNDQAQCDEMSVETEVRAAHNVLEACAQTDTMERVVFTSSVTAVVWSGGRRRTQAAARRREVLERPRLLQEVQDNHSLLWHALAKTLSEKTAWALAMDRGVDMVTINAGLVSGPGLTAAHPYLKGAPDMYDDGVLVTVDADFLADAHVAAYESPTAYGRYLCFDNAVCRPEDAVKLAQMLSPSAPRSPPSDELKVIPQRIQSKKLSKLMVEFANGIYGELD